MSTPARAEAARANGAKSKGPVTPEGRARSSQNAITHGLSAHAVVLHGEQPAEFAELRDSYFQTFQPANQGEADLAESLAVTRWRLRRMPMLEVEVFENIHYKNQGRIEDELDDTASFNMQMGWVFIQAAKGNSPLNLLQRYEGQLTRTYERTLKALQALQKKRLETPSQELHNEPKPAVLRAAAAAPRVVFSSPFPENSPEFVPIPAPPLDPSVPQTLYGALHSDS